ncbi:MAG TPA: glycosyltransferase family 4 protein [Thermoanaerobaculia bacterium]|jgi:glycosyltransferase involved in cell wall biosynthesis|nr:glycosyltransferase family 4 protein [Thermoanaerobaculia bacterium]
MKILVTHPGRQHSHQAALALEREGMLAGYWAGVPALEQQMGRVPPWLRPRLARYEPVEIDRRRARWFPATPSLRRLGDILLPSRAAARVDLLACRLFDRWAAAGLPRAGADAVIACEISALATFTAARRLGMATILDAPSLHHQAQDRLHGTTDSPELHDRILRIKDEEIALADQVLTVSSLARDTYVEAGVPGDRVHAVMLGADLELFTPAPPGGGPGGRGDDGGFCFLYCGAPIRRKGFDLLLDAFDRVAAGPPAARLRVVGPRGDAASLVDGRGGGRIALVGPIGQPALAEELRRADCLVLPSRNDSYGMVVTEALACGVPVLVSEMVGAKELVVPGRNGWIVPAGDAAALAERMAWCVRNRAAVRGMREQCRRSAAAATWPAYHRRLTELLRAIVPERAAA